VAGILFENSMNYLSTKSQAPISKEISSIKPKKRNLAPRNLEFGTWSFFGFWSLGFGVSAALSLSE
jgi:hypothetical protein